MTAYNIVCAFRGVVFTDPELTRPPLALPILLFGVEVDADDGDGDAPLGCRVRVAVIGAYAAAIAPRLHKGAAVNVSGHLQGVAMLPRYAGKELVFRVLARRVDLIEEPAAQNAAHGKGYEA